jgi:energy-coupling factor transporter ATP-binding protein EcfA2
MSSDAHTLSALGKNAAGNRKLTRLKMEGLSFAALRVALEDSTARVRIEETIPADVPRFIGMRISGGFLANQVVRFNKNLNCIIGGRGTGKSTLIESLRVGSGTDISREDFVDSDAWPDKIELVYKDQSGREQTFVREKLGETVNQTDPEQGITRIAIESYGQGDTADAIQHSDKDPSVLLRFLDEFLAMDQLIAEDEQLRESLLDNQTAVERLSIDIKGIPDVEKAKKNADEQVRVLKEKEAGRLVILEEKLANGKAFRRQLVEDLNEIVESAQEALSDTVTLESLASRDGSDLPVGREQFEDVRQLLQTFAKKLAKHSTDIQTECEEIAAQIQEKLAVWRSAEVKVQQELDAVRKELEGKGVRLDLGFIKKATKDAAEFAAKLQELQRRKTFLGKISTERTDLVGKRKDARKAIFNERSKLAITLERNLKATIVDYSIAVRFGEGRYSPELEEIIKTAMEWRTSRVPRAALIARAMSPLELAEAVRKRDVSTLTSVSLAGQSVFSEPEANQIVDKLSEPRVMFSIERCAYDDLPEIRVSRLIDLPSGEKKNITKSFGKLSLGQQQSILLSIMLFSKNECPLIIDQPEDNLDSEFIYKTFVSVLRTIKERRQVIVVTHNANIAVLGDAELILPLKATSEQAIIQDRGSIDTPTTRLLACSILEGSEEAFRRRMVIYGFR